MTVTAITLTDPVSGNSCAIMPRDGVSAQVLDVAGTARTTGAGSSNQTVYDRVAAHGSYDVTLYLTEAAVTLTMILYPPADPAQSIESVWDSISALLDPSLRPVLTVSNDAWAGDRQVTVRYDSDSKPFSDPTNWVVQVSWKAPDAVWEAALESQYNIPAWLQIPSGLYVTSSGALVTSSGLYLTAGSGAQQTEVTNGAFAAQWQAALYGPCSGPALINASSGASLSLSALTLAAGDYVYLDSRLQTARRASDGADVTSLLDFTTSSWWLLAAGTNLITYEVQSAGTGGGPEAVLTFRSSWKALSMTLHTPVFVQPAGADPSIPFSAQELRRNLQAILSVASPITQAGVTPLDGQFAVTQHAGGANFSVDVAAGHAFVLGSDVANQSVYGCWNDGVVNVTTPSAPASGTEVHRLVLQIEDKYSNAVWTGYTANLNLLADTGSGTPAQPASSITLALISIAAGQASVLNANITDERPLLGVLPSAMRTTNSAVHTGGTPTADTVLSVPLVGSAGYEFRIHVIYSGTIAGGFKMALVPPSGATGFYAGSWDTTGGGSFMSSPSGLTGSFTQTIGSNGGAYSLRMNGSIITTSPGTLTIYYSENGTSTGASLLAGSLLVANRIK